MNCKTTVEMLSAYLDRELGPSERDAVRSHLAGCDRCRADERDLRALKGILLGVRAPEPAVGFERRLMSRLHEEAQAPVRRSVSLPRLSPLIVGQFGGFALAATLAAAVLFQSARPQEVRSAPKIANTVARIDVERDAQHSEAYHLAAEDPFESPLLSP